MLPSEKVTCAGKICEDCGETLVLKVCLSFSGYYIGTECSCGPYSRESDYFQVRETAQKALEEGNFSRSE